MGDLYTVSFTSLNDIQAEHNQYHEKKYAENEMKFYSKEAHRRNTYLKEKNLTEKYEKWLEAKQNPENDKK